jgi:hypothetical protein
MRQPLLVTAIGALLVLAVPASHARENVDGLPPALDPMTTSHPGLSEAAHIVGTSPHQPIHLPQVEDGSVGLPPYMRIAIRSIGNVAPLPVTFGHSNEPAPRFTYRLPREVSSIDRTGALLDQQSASIHQDAAPDPLDRVVQVFRETPLARATLRYLITPHNSERELAPFLLINNAESPSASIPQDENDQARLEVRPVWGSVRGALLRVVF